MPVNTSDIIKARDSRVPFCDLLASEPREKWGSVALVALPYYTGISADNAEAFAEKLRKATAVCDFGRMLTLIRDSFTEFRYDDFPQLEAHYQDVLAVMGALLQEYLELEGVAPGKVEWILGSGGEGLHVCFNLRGSAEEAAEKLSFSSPALSKRIGVSFSAFDRTIDRWCFI